MLFVQLSNAKSLFLLIDFLFCLFKVDIYEVLIVPLICQLLFGIMMSNKPRDESEKNICTTRYHFLIELNYSH